MRQLVKLIYLEFQDRCKFQWEQQLVVFEHRKGQLKGIFQLVKKQITQDLPVYDNAGNTWTMRVEFKQTSEHNYTYKVQMRNDSKKETEFKDVPGAGGNMTFDAVGNPNRKSKEPIFHLMAAL